MNADWTNYTEAVAYLLWGDKEYKLTVRMGDSTYFDRDRYTSAWCVYLEGNPAVPFGEKLPPHAPRYQAVRCIKIREGDNISSILEEMKEWALRDHILNDLELIAYEYNK